MAQNLQSTTRRCSAGERCASYDALGGAAKLSRGNPGLVCYACEERRVACELGKGSARKKPPARGAEPRLARPRRGPLTCVKGSCQRPAGPLYGGVRLCREYAEVGLARSWQEGRSLWALTCECNLRDALASGDEGLTRKWSGLLEEAKARLAQAEADLSAKAAGADR
jgi:hypothetical protein